MALDPFIIMEGEMGTQGGESINNWGNNRLVILVVVVVAAVIEGPHHQ